MTQQIAALPSRALLRLRGEETGEFLQNLITCDVTSLTDGSTSFGALLTPQGKILFEFFVMRDGTDFLIDCPATQRDDLQKRLMFYRLRARIDIDADDKPVSAGWPEANGGFADPRHAKLGNRIVGRVQTSTTENAYNAHRMSLGIPQIGDDYLSGERFPHEVLMDQFGGAGIDFSKGCYVGQEVVSRMQHRGTARSRFIFIRSEDGAELPDRGTPVEADGRALGEMGGHFGDRGLALIRLDRAAKAMAGSVPITCAGTLITLSLPDFVSFDWPDA